MGKMRNAIMKDAFDDFRKHFYEQRTPGSEEES
jgi:uncharacterized membrane protein